MLRQASFVYWSRLTIRLAGWLQQRRLLLLYLAQPGKPVAEEVETGLQRLGLQVQGSAIQMAYHTRGKKVTEHYSIDELPFSLGLAECKQLLSQ